MEEIVEPEVMAALHDVWELLTDHFVASARTFVADPLTVYRATDPLVAAIVFCLGVAAYCFIMGTITGNYSKVDQLWSLLPVAYAGHFAWARDFADTRLNVMFGLVALWGARLTFNFWRKGGYNGEEDYRWPVLRKTWPLTNVVTWQLFNLLFIALYQNVLLLLIALPAYAAYLHGASAFGAHPTDYVAAGLIVFFVAMETLADQQQWTFQNEKYARKAAKKTLTGDYKRGFLTEGLFRYSRHPNFFAEQCVWWALYLFVPALVAAKFHWSIIGPVLLSLLFQGSTAFTEALSVGKYPEYKQYQRTTSRLMPWLPGPSLDRAAKAK